MAGLAKLIPLVILFKSPFEVVASSNNTTSSCPGFKDTCLSAGGTWVEEGGRCLKSLRKGGNWNLGQSRCEGIAPEGWRGRLAIIDTQAVADAMWLATWDNGLFFIGGKHARGQGKSLGDYDWVDPDPEMGWSKPVNPTPPTPLTFRFYNTSDLCLTFYERWTDFRPYDCLTTATWALCEFVEVCDCNLLKENCSQHPGCHIDKKGMLEFHLKSAVPDGFYSFVNVSMPGQPALSCAKHCLRHKCCQGFGFTTDQVQCRLVAVENKGLQTPDKVDNFWQMK